MTNHDPITPPDNDSPDDVAPADSRRSHVLYARVTASEKKRVKEQARRADLSISRYVTRFVLDGKAPPSSEERHTLKTLISLFRRTENGLGHLETQARAMRLFHHLPGVEEDFASTKQSLAGLIQELEKRL